jgi:hypothetical protein
MTAEDIAARLLNGKPITVDRLKKMRALCQRSNVDVLDVLKAIPLYQVGPIASLLDRSR